MRRNRRRLTETANDGHDTSVTTAGKWVKSFLTPLLTNKNFMQKTLVILSKITFHQLCFFSVSTNRHQHSMRQKVTHPIIRYTLFYSAMPSQAQRKERLMERHSIIIAKWLPWRRIGGWEIWAWAMPVLRLSSEGMKRMIFGAKEDLEHKLR